MENLSRIKISTVLILIVSGLAGLALITSCGTDEGTKTDNSGRKNTGGKTDTDGKGTLTCSALSGNGSCGDEEKCIDLCEDELQLSKSAALSECKKLDKDTVEELAKLFDDFLKKPILDDLKDLDLDDLELMCGAVKTIGKDILEEKTSKYSASSAKNFLAWMAEKDEVLDVFRAIEEVEDDGDEEVLKMLKEIIAKIGTGKSDVAILTGLAKSDLGEDNNEHFLRIAEENNNTELIKYVHKELIGNDKELCDKKNHPMGISGQIGFADRNDNEEACILGVYCTIAPPDSSDNSSEEFRENVSKIVSVNFNRLVKSSLANGGLGLTEEDAEDWTNAACAKLKVYWSNKSGGLDILTYPSN